ncbi:hypothetical protein JKP88DRAFT_247619 [Tribonema minus]|uniref:Uncharacterized protein n=1 Tax=Tribonema minus TaxID=303371 RepID=A0A836CAI8_9STRA|nr:hypothetical protein JKP88DRAFT_247619 [Tribonema minus]
MKPSSNCLGGVIQRLLRLWIGGLNACKRAGHSVAELLRRLFNCKSTGINTDNSSKSILKRAESQQWDDNDGSIDEDTASLSRHSSNSLSSGNGYGMEEQNNEEPKPPLNAYQQWWADHPPKQCIPQPIIPRIPKHREPSETLRPNTHRAAHPQAKQVQRLLVKNGNGGNANASADSAT